MHIHKPKIGHSLFEFLKELGTIVLGILIALSLEALVERIHWANEVRKGEAALRKEIAINDRYFQERAAAAPCMQRRLQQTAALIEEASAKGRLPQVDGVSPGGLGRLIEVSAWQSQQAAQVLVHYPDDELAGLSTYYTQTGQAEGWRNTEGGAWRTLSIMDGPAKRITDADVAGLRVSLQDARAMARIWESQSRPMMDLARKLGIKPLPIDSSYVARLCREIRVDRSGS
jgi:hypothetical protein